MENKVILLLHVLKLRHYKLIFYWRKFMGFIFGLIIGVVFAQLILRLFNIGWKKIEKEIGNLEK